MPRTLGGVGAWLPGAAPAPVALPGLRSQDRQQCHPSYCLRAAGTAAWGEAIRAAVAATVVVLDDSGEWRRALAWRRVIRRESPKGRGLRCPAWGLSIGEWRRPPRAAAGPQNTPRAPCCGSPEVRSPGGGPARPPHRRGLGSLEVRGRESPMDVRPAGSWPLRGEGHLGCPSAEPRLRGPWMAAKP